MSVTAWRNLTLAGISTALVACGQTSFTGKPGAKPANKSVASTSTPEPQATTAPAESESGTDKSATSATGDAVPGSADKVYDIAGATADDAKALNSCLNLFKSHPFGDKIANFKKINAAISILGSGTPIDDKEKTDTPVLILISTTINVGGSPTYNMLNPNGYYCMKTSINLLTDLTINVSCSAHLADSSFKFDVLSDVKGTNPAKNGLYVASKVVINDLKDDEAKYPCIR
jgi:hypothetical protein